MEFSRQEYWCGLLCPSPEDLPNSEIEPRSPTLQTDFFLQSEPPGKPISKKHHLKRRVSNWSQKRVGRDLGTKATITTKL